MRHRIQCAKCGEQHDRDKPLSAEKLNFYKCPNCKTAYLFQITPAPVREIEINCTLSNQDADEVKK